MNKEANDFRKRLLLRKAYNRVEQLKKFYLRVGVYLTVNLFLLAVWLYDPYVAENFWIPTSFFTVVVAGLFILANGINLYGQRFMLSEQWEARKIRKLIQDNQQTKYE